jgi:hypothetical protein
MRTNFHKELTVLLILYLRKIIFHKKKNITVFQYLKVEPKLYKEELILIQLLNII